MTTAIGPRNIQVAVATQHDRDAIYRLRHRVYAAELGQHPENSEGRLTDASGRV